MIENEEIDIIPSRIVFKRVGCEVIVIDRSLIAHIAISPASRTYGVEMVRLTWTYQHAEFQRSLELPREYAIAVFASITGETTDVLWIEEPVTSSPAPAGTTRWRRGKP